MFAIGTSFGRVETARTIGLAVNPWSRPLSLTPVLAPGQARWHLGVTMKIFVFLAVAAMTFSGCSTFNKSTIASVRAAGVSERTVGKLEHRGVLAPGDLVELKKHGISDAVSLRQLDEVGVDYAVQRNDVRRLRTAGVAPVVTDALVDASDRFMRDRAVPSGYYTNDYATPWHYGGPWWWPEVTLGYSWSTGCHHNFGCHH